jgi:hypothetical protein
VREDALAPKCCLSLTEGSYDLILEERKKITDGKHAVAMFARALCIQETLEPTLAHPWLAGNGARKGGWACSIVFHETPRRVFEKGGDFVGSWFTAKVADAFASKFQVQVCLPFHTATVAMWEGKPNC